MFYDDQTFFLVHGYSLFSRKGHYENMSVQYVAISKSTKNDIFKEAVLTSTHNLCFRAKIRKMYTPVNPSFTI